MVEKNKALKDIAMLLMIIITIVIGSFLINGFNYSILSSYNLESKYMTNEIGVNQYKIDIVNSETGKLTSYERTEIKNILFFSYSFDINSGILETHFTNNVAEDKIFYVVKNGLYDKQDNLYYYAI